MIEEAATECPFCGRKPQSVQVKTGRCQLHGEQMYNWMVKCVIPSCKVNPAIQGNIKENVIRDWNIRLTTEEAQEKLKNGKKFY